MADGSLLCILKAESLELRAEVDRFSSVIATAIMDPDPMPHCRVMCYTATGGAIAVAGSAGEIAVYQVAGVPPASINLVCTLPAEPGAGATAAGSAAVAGLSFGGKERNGLPELIAVLRGCGRLDAYFIGDAGAAARRASVDLRVQFSSVGGLIVSGALVVVAGGRRKGNPGAGVPGVCGWRIVDAEPCLSPLGSPAVPVGPEASGDCVGVLSFGLSPDGSALAALDCRGTLHTFAMPSLRHTAAYAVEQAAGATAEQGGGGVPSVISASWWTDDAVLLMRSNGALTVTGLPGLENHLGDEAEYFTARTAVGPGRPAAAAASGAAAGLAKAVMVECSTEPIRPKRGEAEARRAAATGCAGAVARLRDRLYETTAIDALKPPRTCWRVRRTFRLLQLESMTPTILFARKVREREYGTASAIAKKYGLNTDLMYRTRWTNEKLNKYSVKDLLGKVTDRGYVMGQVFSCSPPDLGTAVELLELGLKSTSIKKVFGASAPDAELSELMEAATLEQRDLCQKRLELLQRRDRLRMYEVVLGYTDDEYDPETASRYLTEPMAERAYDLAADGQFEALRDMIIRHGDDVLPSLFGILFFVPETTDPAEFKSLLPKQGEEDGTTRTIITRPWRAEPDWVETTPVVSKLQPVQPGPPTRLASHLTERGALDLLDLDPSSAAAATRWYTARAEEVEKIGFADYALKIVGHGMYVGVPGLESLLADLQGFNTIIYDTDAGPLATTLTLEAFQSMSFLERAECMLMNSTDSTYARDLKRLVMPYLNQQPLASRDPDAHSLLGKLLIDASMSSLAKCLAVVQSSAPGSVPQRDSRVIADPCELARITIDCIYACTAPEELDTAVTALGLMPVNTFCFGPHALRHSSVRSPNDATGQSVRPPLLPISTDLLHP